MPSGEKKWFALLTKRNHLHRVARLLDKRNLNFVTLAQLPDKPEKDSLFQRHESSDLRDIFFVESNHAGLSDLLTIRGIIGFLYWKNSPVLVTDEEINAIRYMKENYSRIHLVKSAISQKEKVTISQYSIKPDPARTVDHLYNLTVHFPRLGFSIVTETDQTVNIRTLPGIFISEQKHSA